MRLWIDTDVGDNPDDTVALWCAAHAPDVVLAGVSTVDGDVQARAQTVRVLLAETPVFPGCPPTRLLRDVDVFLGIGPWTNVAALGAAHALPQRVVLMGGLLQPREHRGQVRTVEHNVARDPAAARRLVSGREGLVVVPLDATAPLTTDPGEERAIGAGVPLVATQLERWRARHGPVPFVLHDPAALLVALGTAPARTETMALHVDADGRMRVAENGVRHHVVTAFDADATRARLRALVTKGD